MPPLKQAPGRARDFQAVFDELKKLLQPYAGQTLRAREQPGDFQLIAPPAAKSKGREVELGAVRLGKSYVSYHLMPVYAVPRLLDGLSPALRKRMQGKSCFNFSTVDPVLFAELKQLTRTCYTGFKQAGWLS